MTPKTTSMPWMLRLWPEDDGALPAAPLSARFAAGVLVLGGAESHAGRQREEWLATARVVLGLADLGGWVADGQECPLFGESQRVLLVDVTPHGSNPPAATDSPGDGKSTNDHTAAASTTDGTTTWGSDRSRPDAGGPMRPDPEELTGIPAGIVVHVVPTAETVSWQHGYAHPADLNTFAGTVIRSHEGVVVWERHHLQIDARQDYHGRRVVIRGLASASRSTGGTDGR